MLSIGFKLGEDGKRNVRLIAVPFANPVLFTNFCDKTSQLSDELNKSGKVEFIGWKRIELKDRQLGTRIKFKAGPDLSSSELVVLVIEALEEVYKCDIRVINERQQKEEEIV